jgi:hypothetical protein
LILEIILLEVGEPASYRLPAPPDGDFGLPYRMRTSKVTAFEDAEAEWD